MLYQLIALVGAAVVLSAYLGLQRGWMRPDDRRYHILNFAGASMLTFIAIVDQRWGFILLESVWALAAVPGMIQRRPTRAR